MAAFLFAWVLYDGPALGFFVKLAALLGAILITAVLIVAYDRWKERGGTRND